MSTCARRTADRPMGRTLQEQKVTRASRLPGPTDRCSLTQISPTLLHELHRALLYVALLAMTCATAGVAGPNRHGTLILHASSELTYSEDLTGIEVSLESCESANVSVPRDPLVRTLCSVFAAFPPEEAIGFTSVSFGIEYDPAALEIVDYASLAELEISALTWPAPHQGVVLIWLAPQVDQLVEVYRLLVTTVADGELALIPHPSDGGRFGVQGDGPWEFDPISDYGRLGFGAPGYLPCPQPEPSPVVETSWGWIKWKTAKAPLEW